MGSEIPLHFGRPGVVLPGEDLVREGIEDLALTTNGVLLAQHAAELRAQGLSRVTVSLDSVDPATFRRMNGGFDGLDRVLDLLAEPLETAHTPPTAQLDPALVRGQITFDNVSFHYPASEQLVLRDVSLDVPAGATVALVGRSGAGKTTFSNLVARFYDPTSGAVRLDGQDLRELPVGSSFDPSRGTALHWLRGIARTQTALHFRRRQTRPEAAGDDFRAVARDADADPLAEAETAAAVRQVLGALPQDYEILLVGKYLDGLTLDELAQAAGSTAEATSSKLARARRAFREAFHALTGDDHSPPRGGDQLRTQRVEA